MFTDLERVDPGLRNLVEKLAKSFLVWNNKLFKETLLGLKIVVEGKNREPTFKMFNIQIEHWEAEISTHFITERFW